MPLDLDTRATGGYPADLRGAAGVKIVKAGLRADLSLELRDVQQLNTAPVGGLVPVQDPATGLVQALSFEQLPTANTSPGSQTNSKLAPMPALTVKGNTTGANAQPQDISFMEIAAPGNPVGDAISAKIDAKAVRSLAASYQVQPNMTIQGPDGKRFNVNGVTFLDGLFISFGDRPDYRFRTEFGLPPTSGGSPQTGYEPTAWVSEGVMRQRMAAWVAVGVNLFRVPIEPAVFYTSAANGYPAHIEMMDAIVDAAQSLGAVVQFQSGNDKAPTSLNVTLHGFLRDRYYPRPNVWICTANEINCLNGGSDCTNPTVWLAEQKQYIQALRADVTGMPGVKFKGVIVLNAPFYGESIRLVADAALADPVIGKDINLAWGVHMYKGAEATFEARIPSLLDEWGKYLGKLCIFMDEFGLNSGSVTADGTWLAKAMAYLRDLQATTAFSGVTVFCGSWYIPGLAAYDSNSLRLQDGSWTPFGDVIRDGLLSPTLPAKTGWTDYTPMVTAETPGGTPPTFTKNSAAYEIVNKTLRFRADYTVNNAGTGSGRIVLSMPVPLAAGFAQTEVSGASQASGKPLFGITSSSSVLLNYIDLTSPIATGNRVVVGGTFEIA